MIKKFCDKCENEHTQAKPVFEFQLTAKIEGTEGIQSANDEDQIEFERYEFCKDCVRIIAATLNDFVKAYLPKQ